MCFLHFDEVLPSDAEIACNVDWKGSIRPIEAIRAAHDRTARSLDDRRSGAGCRRENELQAAKSHGTALDAAQAGFAQQGNDIPEIESSVAVKVCDQPPPFPSRASKIHGKKPPARPDASLGGDRERSCPAPDVQDMLAGFEARQTDHLVPKDRLPAER